MLLRLVGASDGVAGVKPPGSKNIKMTSNSCRLYRSPLYHSSPQDPGSHVCDTGQRVQLLGYTRMVSYLCWKRSKKPCGTSHQDDTSLKEVAGAAAKIVTLKFRNQG